MFLSTQVSILQPNVWAETNISLTGRNTMSAVSAGLHAHPGTPFKEPDSGLPLKCDMCEELPEGEQPLCVQWCLNDALVYEEREEEVDEEVKLEDVDIGLESMVDKYGLQKVLDTVARMSKKE